MNKCEYTLKIPPLVFKSLATVKESAKDGLRNCQACGLLFKGELMKYITVRALEELVQTEAF